MKTLIIGANGQLGSELQHAALKRKAGMLALDLPEFDMTDSRQIERVFKDNRINAVINAAAYTAVDKAEEDETTAFSVNAKAPGLLAQACHKDDIPFLHVSTDYVFDGNKKGAYREDDPTNPLGIYGTSKLAGEEAIRKHWSKHLIVRTAWLYGVNGPNFVKTMLHLFRSKDKISVVDDQLGCPTDAKDLAEALWSMLDEIESGRPVKWGAYHFCGQGQTSWFGFAQQILKYACTREELEIKTIDPVTTAQYPTPAHRPANSVMDCSKISLNFNVLPRPWQDSLADMMTRLYDQASL